MNTMKKEICIGAAILLAVVGGFALLIYATRREYKPAQTYEASSNPGIDVQLVLEHEGVKVYRFWDGVRTIYYTDARGRTSWKEVHSTGKTTYTEDHEVETTE